MRPNPAARVLLLLITLPVLAVGAFPVLAAPAAADGLLDLTLDEVTARWGQPALVQPNGPYALEYAVPGEGVEVRYQLMLAPEPSTGREVVVEYCLRLSRPLTLRQAVRAVPELRFLTASGSRFTYYLLPTQAHAWDVDVFGYPPPAGPSQPGSGVAALFVVEGYGPHPEQITAEAEVSTVVVTRHSPYPGEVSLAAFESSSGA